MAVDISFIGYFGPIFAFLIVAIVSFVLISKAGFIENKLANFIVSFMIASLFISFAGLREYALTIIPWFGVLVVALVLIMVVIGFTGLSGDWGKGVGKVFVVILGLVFLVSAFVVFSNVITPYLPGPTFAGGDIGPGAFFFLEWLYSPRVGGAILLLVLSAIVGWVLVKGGK